MSETAKRFVLNQLDKAGVAENGPNPWDPQVHNDALWGRLLRDGTLGLGEAYMDGWWDAAELDQFLFRLISASIQDAFPKDLAVIWSVAKGKLLNMQRLRVTEVGEKHYDIGNDLYAAMLDKRMIYSCAYWKDAGDLDTAQEAKLDLICRKLMLQPGERFLDIGAGWGGLLLWAAEHYGVDATGITLSRNQHAHVSRLIVERGLSARVRIELRDYRELDEGARFDKIASVGMFEHVGQANMPAYFGKIARLLAPGGLVLNHGITAGRLEPGPLGAGMGEFIGKYIFPGGELLHVSHVLRELAGAGLEMVDTENLRPHYARTLWAWSDALENRLAEAQAILERTHGPEGGGAILRAYRLYLAGCAMCFEQGWIALHQMLATRPDGRLETGALRGAQSAYPFNRAFMYR
jgi:cyclopropane-fatty-acyl-phospholipid synthase